MDYLVEHASEIMRLCFGIGFLVLMLVLSHSVLAFTHVAKKVDQAADLLLKLISAPVTMSLQIKEIVDHVYGYFGKKDND